MLLVMPAPQSNSSKMVHTCSLLEIPLPRQSRRATLTTFCRELSVAGRSILQVQGSEAHGSASSCGAVHEVVA